ncbi:MAG: hypothetical protein OHK0029_04090 [Armatimonadaceae bacterium]
MQGQGGEKRDKRKQTAQERTGQGIGRAKVQIRPFWVWVSRFCG